ncbi:MAG: prepilin-type N-terminal cleavage/methylation domain-containing protein [Candidatus Muirbacterium halophilum]|nr:prepilin-type N-terminal cleavage/methylation domain-containing protein [Candidatus Muirbacterium halophilum]MCK9475006.1 prepilin-type N-terminal cleavage/methylation domain-containing protein [Candidatus Muirbacterium halophilum]
MRLFNNKGFSLIELIVTLIIITIAASVVFPVSRISYVREKEDDLKYFLKRFRVAIDDFKENNPKDGVLPPIVVPGDGVDDDVDGFIDEEIHDGIDNDGDGFVDEDLCSYGYPVSLWSLVQNHKIRKIPKEPFGGVWQYRTSFSAPDEWKDFIDYGGKYEAQPGDDIYDIRTSSPKLSISGEVYNTW